MVNYAILYWYSYLWTYNLHGHIHNAFGEGISITRAIARGMGPGNRDFFGSCDIAFGVQNRRYIGSSMYMSFCILYSVFCLCPVSCVLCLCSVFCILYSIVYVVSYT